MKRDRVHSRPEIHRYLFSEHAVRRMGQRGIRRCHAEMALLYGYRWRRHGAEHAVLTARSCRENRDGVAVDDKAIGTVVVFRDDIVLTVYRNRQAPRNLRRSGACRMRRPSR